ncbi:ComEC/Rec2 family competence protein [Chryseobacterium sp. Leaf180]|uniref:ComEC/Rec2 family competence protein n=1 Tax=Chryseobacterium sp. Leaf180 TaxID=1736289 RepID=UPI001EE70D0D|nr:ComEC/Rec2 family competence protein [Chryseobacterium sp. Leaf180]
MIIFSVIFIFFSSVTLLLRHFIFQTLRPYFLGLLFFGLGTVMHYFNFNQIKNSTENSNHEIVFKITKKLNSSEKNKKYEAEIISGNQTLNAVVFIPKENEELDFRHFYKAKAFVTSPQKPQHDFQFDYSKYLQRKNIAVQCYISENIEIAERKDLTFEEKIRQNRLDVLQKINSTPMSAQSREFLKGIILADRTEMDSETVRDFNRSGLVHFLAISGTHIVIVFGIFYYLMTRFSPLRFRKYAIISSLLFIWFFTAFIGFGSSVVRSSMMLTVYFSYVLLQRKPDFLHALSLSALIILFADTQQLFDVGFQLSFLAVLGIFWLNQPILKLLPRQDNRIKKVFYNTVSISLAAQLATVPLVLYYFHQFSFISIPANLFIVPLSEIVIVFSFVLTGFIAVGIDINFIFIIYDYLILFLLKIIHWFAGFEKVFFENVAMNLTEVAAAFAAVYFLRFVLIKFSVKNISNFVCAVLLFVMVKTGFNLNESLKNEMLVHQFKKEKIVSLKIGNTACFFIPETENSDKINQYIINPYVASRRIKSFQIKETSGKSDKVVFNGKTYDLR